MLALSGGLVVALTGFPGRTAVARADTTPNNNNNPYFTLSVDPTATQNLVDGQAIPFAVTRTDLGTSTGLEIAAVGTGWCQSDVQLPVSEDPGNQTFNTLTTGFPVVDATTPGAPPANCLDYVNSDLSAIIANGSSLPTIAPQTNTSVNVAGGAGDYPTVSGQTLAEVGEGGQQQEPFNGLSVNCLPTEPCTLAVAVWTVNVLVPGQNEVYFVGVPMTFQSSSAGLACNGPALEQTNSESPDHLGETVTLWGIDACKSGDADEKALTFNLGSSKSDDEALSAFAGGTVDLAYSAVGYGGRGGLLTVELPRWRSTSAPIRRHPDRAQHGGPRTFAERGRTAALPELRDRALRLPAAQDHGRPIRPAAEQWRQRGRLRERSPDRRHRDLGESTGRRDPGLEPGVGGWVPGLLLGLRHRRRRPGCRACRHFGYRRHDVSPHPIPRHVGAQSAGERAKPSGRFSAEATGYGGGSARRLPPTTCRPIRGGESSVTT